MNTFKWWQYRQQPDQQQIGTHFDGNEAKGDQHLLGAGEVVIAIAGVEGEQGVIQSPEGRAQQHAEGPQEQHARVAAALVPVEHQQREDHQRNLAPEHDGVATPLGEVLRLVVDDDLRKTQGHKQDQEDVDHLGQFVEERLLVGATPRQSRLH